MASYFGVNRKGKYCTSNKKAPENQELMHSLVIPPTLSLRSGRRGQLCQGYVDRGEDIFPSVIAAIYATFPITGYKSIIYSQYRKPFVLE